MGMKLSAELTRKVLQQAGAAAAPAEAGDLAPAFAEAEGAGFGRPDPEYRFHPRRGWRFDWAYPRWLVAVEREGGTFKTIDCPGCGFKKTVFVSRHHSRDGLEADAEKYNAAAAAGWCLVRLTPGMIKDGRAAAALLDALRRRSRS